jgi:hypothetical protein
MIVLKIANYFLKCKKLNLKYFPFLLITLSNSLSKEGIEP